MPRNYSNLAAETTLAASALATDTQITVTATTGFPVAFPYTLILAYQSADVEIVTVTAQATNVLTVVRGEDGTTAKAHDAGARVVHGITARDISDPQTLAEIMSPLLTANAGDVPVYDQAAGEWVPRTGYRFLTRVVFEESGSFVKANYPGIRAARVRAQAAGGGGAASRATASGELSAGCGAGGGEYAESFLLESVLAASETVTIGAAGIGGVPPGGNGTTGGDTSLGLLVVAMGGNAGFDALIAGASLSLGTSIAGFSPGGTGGTGDILVPGGFGGIALRLDGSTGYSGYGGDSMLGRGARPIHDTSAVSGGLDGAGYGGGGSGGLVKGTSSGSVGGDGAPGVLYVDVYV